MVKINAQVEAATRERIRTLASEHGSSVQTVTQCCISMGLIRLEQMAKKQRAGMLPPDPRRAKRN